MWSRLGCKHGGCILPRAFLLWKSGKALEQAVQGSDGVPVPGEVLKKHGAVALRDIFYWARWWWVEDLIIILVAFSNPVYSRGGSSPGTPQPHTAPGGSGQGVAEGPGRSLRNAECCPRYNPRCFHSPPALHQPWLGLSRWTVNAVRSGSDPAVPSFPLYNPIPGSCL